MNNSYLNIFERRGTDIIIWLTAGLLIFVPFREIAAYHMTENVKIVADVLVLSIVIIAIFSKKLVIKINAIDLAFISFVMLSFLSAMVNKTEIMPAALQLRGFSIFYILYFILRNLTSSSDKRRSFLKITSSTLMSVIAVLVFFAIIETIFGKEALFPHGWAADIRVHNLTRAYGLIGNPNILAAFLIMSAVIVKQAYDKLGLHLNKHLYAIPAVGIILSQSRSGLIVSAAIIIYIMLPKFANGVFLARKHRASTVGAILLIATIPLLLIIYAPDSRYGENRFLDAINGNEIRNSIIDGRLYLVGQSIGLYTNHENYLLGLGAGMLNNQTTQTNRYGLASGFTSDNQYLKVFVETGILGFAAFITLLICLAARHRKDKLAIMMIFAMLFWGLFYNSLEVQVVSLLFWLAMVLSEVNHKYSLSSSQPHTPSTV